MKTLFLVRHAKSSWKYPDLDDFERPLNKRGRKNAPFMGSILKGLQVNAELILSSPAIRAAITARTIALCLDYPLEDIVYSEASYHASEHDLLDVVAGQDDRFKGVMLVGHNPGLTTLANSVGDTPISNIPTCGACGFELNILNWNDVRNHRGKLIFFEYPKKHAVR